MVRAQVFSSLCPQGWSCPSTPIYTKSLLVLRLIAPSTLEIPALPTLSLFVPDEFKHALVGWGQIFLYNYTCLIKLKPPRPPQSQIKTHILLLGVIICWSFLHKHPGKIKLTMMESFYWPHLNKTIRAVMGCATDWKIQGSPSSIQIFTRLIFTATVCTVRLWING